VGDCLNETNDLMVLQNDRINNPSVTANAEPPPFAQGRLLVCAISHGSLFHPVKNKGIPHK
jgi:hypothetical protein